MSEKIKHFEKELFLNELEANKFKVETFKNAIIDPLFKIKVLFYFIY